MKFPLSERPLPVLLTKEQCHKFDVATRNLVGRTLREYDAFVTDGQRKMDRREWKAVKSRDDVTVYKQATRDPKSKWALPRLVAVGTISGTLDDVMYGIVTPDAQSILVKTSYVHNEVLDAAVLNTIEHPTVDDPFRSLQLKWIVVGHSRIVNAVVRPRDFVIVESTGIRTRRNGDRVGYHAMHSVRLKQCPELEALSIVRARSSNCYLYREIAPGVVEVYMITNSTPGGNPPERIAVNSAASTLIGMWKAMWCAQNKKLSWLLGDEAIREQFGRASVESANSRVSLSNRRYCHICAKPRGGRWPEKLATDCHLCTAYVCASCRVSRTLSTADYKLDVSTRVVHVCKRCITLVSRADAAKIARSQYIPDYESVDKQWEDFDSARAVHLVFDDLEMTSDYDTVRAMQRVINETIERRGTENETREADGNWAKHTGQNYFAPSPARDTMPMYEDQDEFLYEQMRTLDLETRTPDSSRTGVRGDLVEL